MSFLDKKIGLKFVLVFFIGLVLGIFGVSCFDLQAGEVISEWMTFMSILSTIFAVFFVYSGFRIETVYTKMTELKEEIEKYKDLKKKESNKYINRMKDISEYTIQLEYCMSFIIKKEYEKAIDALTVLKSEVFVLKIPERVSTCHFFLAHCHHEKNTYDDSILAVQYINDVYDENQMNPFKIEIIERFQKFDKMK